jgi:hypothetical protein
MQLKRPQSIRAALAAATCSVLAAPPPLHAQGNGNEGVWDVRSGLLFYQESDRIQIVEPVISASKTLQNGTLLTLRGVADTVTGASPNGATPSAVAQTFTSPSGESSYTTPAGETPLREVEDLRLSLGVEWEKELSRMVRNTLGAGISHETDFLSLTLSDTLKRDLNNRQTTLAAGLALTLDTVSAEGGTPTGLQRLSTPAAVPPPGAEEEDDDDDGKSKNSVELLLGVTQILSRHTLTQLNYTLSVGSGYLTDPYKILSVVNGLSGETVDYRYEKRPDSRTSQNLNWRLNHQFNEDVLYLGYRFFWDDWGLTSHTMDVRYRSELGNGLYLQPHLRLYQQSGADFFRHSLVEGEPLPTHASADLRLGEMRSTTLGIKLGMPLGGGEFSLRLEQMRQEGESHPADAIGIQQHYDLYPTLNASIVQLGYRFAF